MSIKKIIGKLKPIEYYDRGKNFLNDPHYYDAEKKSRHEFSKSPSRTEIINFLLSLNQNDTC